jgi:hypothetical protein
VEDVRRHLLEPALQEDREQKEQDGVAGIADDHREEEAEERQEHPADVGLPVARVDVEEVEHRADRFHPACLMQQRGHVLAGLRIVQDDAPPVLRRSASQGVAIADGQVAGQQAHLLGLVHAGADFRETHRVGGPRDVPLDDLPTRRQRLQAFCQSSGLRRSSGEPFTHLGERTVRPGNEVELGAQIRRACSPAAGGDEAEVLPLAVTM